VIIRNSILPVSLTGGMPFTLPPLSVSLPWRTAGSESDGTYFSYSDPDDSGPGIKRHELPVQGVFHNLALVKIRILAGTGAESNEFIVGRRTDDVQ